AIAPSLSGVIVKYFEWPELFFLTLSLAEILMLLIFLFMPNVTNQKETNIDIISILLSTVAFGGLLYGFNQLPESGLNNVYTMISLTAGSIALALFIWRQLRLTTPILELRVF